MEEIREEQMIQAQPAEQAVQEGRDFETEVKALYEARPELRGSLLPEEVATACVRGRSLTEAYNEYAGRQRSESADLRKENRVLRQNARAAAQAPVRGVSRGGSANTKPEDAFLRGFNEE